MAHKEASESERGGESVWWGGGRWVDTAIDMITIEQGEMKIKQAGRARPRRAHAHAKVVGPFQKLRGERA